MVALRLLTVPWGLIGSDDERVAATAGAPCRIGARETPLVFVDCAAAPLLDGEPGGVEHVAGLATSVSGESQGLFALPAPLDADAVQLLRHPAWREDAVLRRDRAVSRPRRGGAEEDEEPGEPWFRFLLAVVGRMQDFEGALAASHLPWDHVRERWLAPESEQDPFMDVLVRHAREHRARFAEIVDRPRKVLNRRRELVPLARVEELDTHCMAWLSRQPGTTIAERAGDRQRILALARYENRNTLENRVLRDLLERTTLVARDYLRVNAGRVRAGLQGRTGRYALVERYARECRLLAQALAEEGVAREGGPVQPNFVLLQDERYRHVWRAWQEIVRRDRVFDDLWRWQARAFAEFCRAACVVALAADARAQLVAASPLFFRSEHRRGEWLVHDDPIAILHFPHADRVVEILRGDTPDKKSAFDALGATAWLRFATTRGDLQRYLALWTIQGAGAGAPRPIGDLVASADRALAGFQAKGLLKAGLAGGIVLQALPDPAAAIETHVGTRVAGLAFGPSGAQLGPALGRLGRLVLRQMEVAS